MIRLLLIFAILSTCGCSGIRPGWIREDSYSTASVDSSIIDPSIGPLNGHFDDEGNWVPDNPEIAATYKIPDISAGFIFDANDYSVSPTIQIELVEVHTGLPYIGKLKLDAGVAYQRAFLYLGKLWTSIFEITTGIFGGWNFEDNEWSAGVGFTIIRF